MLKLKCFFFGMPLSGGETWCLVYYKSVSLAMSSRHFGLIILYCVK